MFYYGYRGDKSDKWIYEEYQDKISFEKRVLSNTIKSIRECSEFIGADSGLAWVAAFARIKTRIIMGRDVGDTWFKTFEDMDWVKIEWELTNIVDDVTLVCIDCVDLDRAIEVLEKCKFNIPFKNIKLLTSINNKYKNSVKIDHIQNLEEYSKFCLLKLTDFIDTKFCLIIQHDGYILNSSAWSNHWFNYDYIGAPFSYNDQVVGNGGFSLRSKRLLDLCKKYYIEDFSSHGHHEDYVICWHWRQKLQDDLEFSPLEVAKKFSSEKELEISNQFGFHNKEYAKELDSLFINKIMFGSDDTKIDITNVYKEIIIAYCN